MTHRRAWTSWSFVGLASVAVLFLPSPGAGAPPQAATTAQETGVLKGTIKLKGPVPRRSKLPTQGDPKCAAMHREPLLSEDVVADAAGRLQWAFVFVKAGLPERTYEAPKKPVTFDQKSCRFEPHVFGIQAGQELLIRNGDDLMHIVHVIPRNNKEWGFSQARVGETRTKVFEKPERMIRLGCDVHPWMQAWAAVMEHPYFDVTDAQGRFEIKDLPAGKYTIEVWHESYKSVEQEIELKGKETKTFAVELVERKT